jgi:hypothetical protein
MKTCSKCSDTKPLDDFYRSNGTRDGRQSRCKVCACSAAKQWREDNLERARAKDADYYSANRDRKLSYRAGSYAADPDRHRAASRKWYEANRESALARNKEWMTKNKEKR